MVKKGIVSLDIKITELLVHFESWLINEGKSLSTAKTYNGVLKAFNTWLTTQQKDLLNIHRDDIQSYMDYLEAENRSASTIDKVFATIRVFCHYRGVQELVTNIKRKEKETHTYQSIPETLSEKEKESLLANVKKDNDPRNIAIVYTLLYTGIRISELCALSESDIRINGETGTVQVKAEGKSRTIPLPKKVIRCLQQYLKMKGETSEKALFISSFDQRMTTRAVQYMLKKYDVNPIKLRHTFCLDLLKQGVDLSVVAQMAGHEDINVTKRYLKVLEEAKDAIG
jgi:integrase/recombinase XerD